MKALSMWQPWASLWLTPFKVHETRDWETKHRGWLAVHASKRKLDNHLSDELEAVCEKAFGMQWRRALPFGAVIGAVYVEDCKSMRDVKPAHQDDEECGIWLPERFAWRRGENYQRVKPVPMIGRQKIFNIPDAAVPTLPYATPNRRLL